MEKLFTLLYPFVALVSVTAYLPQIISLWKSETKSNDISLSSWGLWAVSGVISLGYGVFCLEDFMFCVVAGIGLFMILVVIAMVAHNRFIRFPRAGKIRPD